MTWFQGYVSLSHYNFVKEKLPNVELKLENIDKCFRLKVKTNSEKPTNMPRPILVKFSSYNTRSAIYKAKKQLKESDGGYFINEDLIPKISSLFAKEALQFKCFASLRVNSTFPFLRIACSAFFQIFFSYFQHFDFLDQIRKIMLWDIS